MWDASSAIFPSVYLLYEGGVEVPVEFNAEYVRSNVAEAVRVADKQQPVGAYSMFYYHTSRLHKESAAHNVSSQGHGDLREEFLGAFQAGAAGTVVWGNDADRGAPQRSELWAAHLHAVAKDFFMEQCNCSATLCRRTGKCLFDRTSDQTICKPFKSDDQGAGIKSDDDALAPPPMLVGAPTAVTDKCGPAAVGCARVRRPARGGRRGSYHRSLHHCREPADGRG